MMVFIVIPVYESFQDYIKVESLDGENKYDAGEHGLQVTYWITCKFFMIIEKSFCFSLIYANL